MGEGGLTSEGTKTGVGEGGFQRGKIGRAKIRLDTVQRGVWTSKRG